MNKILNINIFIIMVINVFKLIYKILIKIVLGVVLLFGYNVFLKPFDFLIPINFVTIFIASFLDVPGIIGLFLLYIMNFQ